jgi:hypothetical protein
MERRYKNNGNIDFKTRAILFSLFPILGPALYVLTRPALPKD